MFFFCFFGKESNVIVEIRITKFFCEIQELILICPKELSERLWLSRSIILESFIKCHREVMS